MHQLGVRQPLAGQPQLLLRDVDAGDTVALDQPHRGRDACATAEIEHVAAWRQPLQQQIQHAGAAGVIDPARPGQVALRDPVVAGLDQLLARVARGRLPHGRQPTVGRGPAHHAHANLDRGMPLIPDQLPQFELVPTSRSRNRVRVVCLGGGTGLSMILRGLKRAAAVTAVVTTTDDGGSSGRLRRDFGMPAPGDVRHCLSALAEDESLVNQLFEHRFTDGELAGHSFGNLFLAGLTDLLGSFDQAVSESARVLAVAGRVVPSTTDIVELVAEVEDGRTVRGETAIAADVSPVKTVWLDPPDPRAHPRSLAAIERADLIVMGPGSLFTSTLPPLLVPGIREAVRAARVPRIYVCNLLQQPGETEGYRASDHVARIYEHVGDDLVDAVLVSRNRAEHGVPVPVDRGGLRRQGVRVFGARLAGEWQHDADKLGRTLVRLSRWNRDELQ